MRHWNCKCCDAKNERSARVIKDSVISTEVEKSLAVFRGSLLGQIPSRDSSTALGMTKSERHRRGA
jgi:hypothetical protein